MAGFNEQLQHNASTNNKQSTVCQELQLSLQYANIDDV